MSDDGTMLLPGFLLHTPFFPMGYFAEVTMNWAILGAIQAPCTCETLHAWM